MGGAASATWDDSLIFERNGLPITSGSVRVSADTDGMISLSGEGAGARATLNLSAGGSSKEVSFTDNGSYQDTLRLIETGEWDAADGLPIKLQLFLGGGNNWFAPSTSEVDFSSTATITSVVYLTPDGQPDPSVTVTSASGVVYGVPEPTCGALAIVCLCSAGGARFRRRSCVASRRGGPSWVDALATRPIRVDVAQGQRHVGNHGDSESADCLGGQQQFGSGMPAAACAVKLVPEPSARPSSRWRGYGSAMVLRRHR